MSLVAPTAERGTHTVVATVLLGKICWRLRLPREIWVVPLVGVICVTIRGIS